MIGDGNGDTTKKGAISANNPFLNIVTSALDKLKVCKGTWGICLGDDTYHTNFTDGNISELECDILTMVSGYDDIEDEVLEKHGFVTNDDTISFLCEFGGLFIDETEYSFLVYEGYKLK